MFFMEKIIRDFSPSAHLWSNAQQTWASKACVICMVANDIYNFI